MNLSREFARIYLFLWYNLNKKIFNGIRKRRELKTDEFLGGKRVALESAVESTLIWNSIVEKTGLIAEMGLVVEHVLVKLLPESH